MEIVEFLIGEAKVPLYRSVTPPEAELLRALLGAEFHFALEEGEPLDELLFDALSALAMRADLFFTPPPESCVLGTFELHDVVRPPVSRRGAPEVAGGPRTH